MFDLTWCISVSEDVDRDNGVYFLRTNVVTLDEKVTWYCYNLIREIECTLGAYSFFDKSRSLERKEPMRRNNYLFSFKNNIIKRNPG